MDKFSRMLGFSVVFPPLLLSLSCATLAHTMDMDYQPGEIETVMLPGDVPLDMVWVPAGTFMRGSPEDEYDREEDETQHEVTLSSGYWMGKYPVTKGQWAAIMEDNPWAGKDYVLDHPESPAVYVTWDDAQDFIKALNRQTGLTFRLPTEAEWEYAVRAGTTTRFYWGDDPHYVEINDYAWWKGNAYDAGIIHAPVVGQKLPNDLGLYDMSGNIWEWCQDWYGPYPEGPVTDPTGPASGANRVLRGGGWSIHGGFGTYCRSANRGFRYPSYPNTRGFRLAR